MTDTWRVKRCIIIIIQIVRAHARDLTMAGIISYYDRYNIYCHIHRQHKDLVQKVRGDVSILPEKRQVQHQIEDEDEADDVPIDVPKDCVVNMFRQTNLRSTPALSGYLEEYYAEILACMRIPIIVSAYTGPHDDIKDGQDVERAKQSMARWRHGLSAIAPTKELSHSSTATSRSSSVSSFRRSKVPNQRVACSTPLSLSSLILNVESPIHVLSEYDAFNLESL